MPIPPVRIIKSQKTFLSVLCRRTPPQKCSIACVAAIFVTPVNQLQKQLGMRSYSKWYYTRSEVIEIQEKVYWF